MGQLGPATFCRWCPWEPELICQVRSGKNMALSVQLHSATQLFSQARVLCSVTDKQQQQQQQPHLKSRRFNESSYTYHLFTWSCSRCLETKTKRPLSEWPAKKIEFLVPNFGSVGCVTENWTIRDDKGRFHSYAAHWKLSLELFQLSFSAPNIQGLFVSVSFFYSRNLFHPNCFRLVIGHCRSFDS